MRTKNQRAGLPLNPNGHPPSDTEVVDYTVHSTRIGGTESIYGKPHHFLDKMTASGPSTRKSARLDLPSRPGEAFRIDCLLEVAGDTRARVASHCRPSPGLRRSSCSRFGRRTWRSSSGCGCSGPLCGQPKAARHPRGVRGGPQQRVYVMPRIRNARGVESPPVPVRRESLLSLGAKLADALARDERVASVIAIGSVAHSEPDVYSDLDLRVVGTDSSLRDCELDLVCRELGGVTDEAGESLHFPLDNPAYLFHGLCVELAATKFAELSGDVAAVLHGQALDHGTVHNLREARILYDRSGEMARWQRRLRGEPYPEALRDRTLRACADVPMKLLIHSVGRRDYPHALYWVGRLYDDMTRMLFAQNRRFFPGMKRTLLRTVPALAWTPAGFREFWGGAFEGASWAWDGVISTAHEHLVELHTGPG